MGCAVAQLPDPVGRCLRILLADGLILKNIGAYGRGGYNLREPPECHLRRGGALFKSGNICILRSGKEAYGSARAIVTALKTGFITAGLSEDYVNLIEDTTRASANELMTADGYIDLPDSAQRARVY